MALVNITRVLDAADKFAEMPQESWPQLLELKAKSARVDLESDVRHLGYVSEEVLDTGAWQASHKSFREFVEKQLVMTWDAYQAIIKALGHIGYAAAMDREQAEKIGRRIAALEARDVKLAGHGGDRKSEERDQDSDRTLKRGETSGYLLARLARDNPEVLGEFERGEHRSVRAAAIKAGIVKLKSPDEKAVDAFRKAENRLVVLTAVIDSLAPHERAWLREVLND